MPKGGKREGAGRPPGSASKLDAEARQRAAEGGIMPLDYLLGVMRDEMQDPRTRLDAAKAAAPYCHARLSSAELSMATPIEVKKTNMLDVSTLSIEELHVLHKAVVATNFLLDKKESASSG